MNHKLKSITALSLSLIFLTGCYPTGEVMPNGPAASVNTGSGETASITEPHEIENLKISLELTGDYPTSAPVIKVKTQEFDVDKMKAFFLDGKTVKEETKIEGRELFIIKTEDDCSLVINNDYRYIDFTEAESSDITTIQRASSSPTREYYKWFPHIESELEGFPRSEAVERADDFVKKLGLKYLGEPIVYTMTAEDAHNYSDQYTASKEDDLDTYKDKVALSKEDEYYFIKYPVAYNGVPISLSKYSDVTSTASHNRLSAEMILTKDKLVWFRCDNVSEIEEIDTSQFKITPEAALSKLYDYYGLMKEIEHPLEFEDFKLVYITSQRDKDSEEFTYIPLWRFTGYKDFSEKPGELRMNTFDKFVNPETGFVYDYDG